MRYISFTYLQEGLTDTKRDIIAIISKFQTKILADLHALK